MTKTTEETKLEKIRKKIKEKKARNPELVSIESRQVLRAEGQEILPAGSLPTKSTRCAASKIWCFAMFPKDKEQIVQFVRVLNAKGEYFCAEEHCPTTGKLHLQGWFKSKVPCRPMETFSDFFARWQKTKGSWEQNFEYCTKGNGERYTNMKILDPVEDPMMGLVLHWWQAEILDIISRPPDPRTVHWYYDKVGNTGKTSFAKSLCLRDKHIIFVNGKANDIKYAIDTMIESKISPRVIIFGYPRDAEGAISYRAIEECKDGMFFNSKYKCKMTLYNPPHVICLANWMPQEDKLSKDRWRIVNIRPVETKVITNPIKSKVISMDDNEFSD